MNGGRAFGIAIIVVAVAILVLGVQYNHKLEQERSQAIAQLISTPQFENCRYDAATCQQAQEVVFPQAASYALIGVFVLLGAYLVRSDTTNRRILEELSTKRSSIGKEERRELLLSVLTTDERRVVTSVIEQPGISQATLRLRTDMSKAKLSMLLKDLETRGIIRKVEDGKTNTVHLKREI